MDDAQGKLATIEAFAGAGSDPAGEAARGGPRGLRDALGILLRRAQDAGAVRADAHLDEVHALLAGASRAAAHARHGEHIRDGVLRIIFDGLTRAEA